jgi:hypothetical protein
MAQVVYAKDVKKVFILADYVNKQDSVFLDYKNEISEFIIKAMNSAGVQNYNLKIIRLCLVDTNKPVFSIQTKRISPLSEAFTITVDNSLDDPSTRKYMYRFVGKSILGTTLTDLTLWKA